MTFVKDVKSKAYCKRFQTKFRRRREGKTDYYARKRLITQAKNKYNSPKYRLVVRITNKDVICQIAYSKIEGDYVLAAAYAHELPRFGIKVGLTNWPACYATGLLLARRLLVKLSGNMAELYTGFPEPDGTVAEVERENDEDPRPFKAFLDVGLVRTTTGARVFAAMKGASDGGILVPHSEQRFPGYARETSKLDTDKLREYIFGGHVGNYMTMLKEEDPEKFKTQFSQYIKNGIDASNIEDMYAKAHEGIRADPSKVSKKRERANHSKKFRQAPLNIKDRKERIRQKKARFFASLEADE